MSSLRLSAALHLWLGLALLPLPATASLWRDQVLGDIPVTGPRLIEPLAARLLELDPAALEAQLVAVPHEFSGAPGIELSLPLPDGREAAFEIHRTDLMHPDLAARYPQIRTFVGRGLDDPAARLRLNLGPRGLHAMILAPGEALFIDPLMRGDRRYYQSYTRANAPRRSRPPDQVLPAAAASGAEPAPRTAFAGSLRTYRLAVAATGDYSHFHDPPPAPLAGLADKAVVLAEIVTAIHRVVGIYERDFGIRMQIVAQNDEVIFQHPVADPYVDGSLTGLEGLPMLFTNTAVLDTLVGAENYDVGHVFSVGGGGVAQLGSVCGSMKGAGVTGLPAPVADPFYVDYVAHEIGHQFGANHTFNGINGACGGNRNASTAYEPGSATTIMGYAGICGADNIQNNSDAHFHAISFDEVRQFVESNGGAQCGELTTVPNRPPRAVPQGSGKVIPVGTPFELVGTATDPDGDSLTAHWEQFDLGPPAAAGLPVAAGPLFRSLPPDESMRRSLPRLADLAAGLPDPGEVLPTVSRDLRFRFTVRDNSPGAGGVDSGVILLRVTDQAGPFRVEAPQGDGFAPGGELEVRWEVANTDAAPVLCGQVDISLSRDGGLSFPETLRRATPNDGVETVSLPPEEIATGRIKVACSDNLFFAISPRNFSSRSLASRSTGAAPARGGALAPGWLLLLLGLGLRRVQRASRDSQ